MGLSSRLCTGATILFGPASPAPMASSGWGSSDASPSPTRIRRLSWWTTEGARIQTSCQTLCTTTSRGSPRQSEGFCDKWKNETVSIVVVAALTIFSSLLVNKSNLGRVSLHITYVPYIAYVLFLFLFRLFSMFKFPNSNRVHFQCDILVCKGEQNQGFFINRKQIFSPPCRPVQVHILRGERSRGQIAGRSFRGEVRCFASAAGGRSSGEKTRISKHYSFFSAGL